MSDIARPRDEEAVPAVVRPLFPSPSWQDQAAAAELSPGEVGPRISSVVVDGYGALAGLELSGLEEGMTVLLGPNEAGKSTLLDFIAAILFGFPARKADERFHPPVRGGRHGGRVVLCDRAGGTWTVERYGPPKKSFTLRRPDGSLGDESDLKALLGGANSELFRTVFAVGLDDLRQLDGVSNDEVREVLFSSSLLGQRRSVARALQALDTGCDTLVRPRQGGRANSEAEELRQLHAELDEARRSAEAFGQLIADRERLACELRRLQEAQDAARAQVRDYELLCRCWDVASKLPQLRQRLEVIEPLSAAERELLAEEARLLELRSQLSGHRERLAGYRTLQERYRVLVEGIDTRVTTLGSRRALEIASEETFDREAVRAELHRLLGALSESRGRLSTARETVERERDRVGRLGPQATSERELPSQGELESRLADLKELRGSLAETDQLERALRQDSALLERQLDGRRAESGAGRQLVATLVAAVVLAVIGALLLSRHQAALGALALLAGAALAALSLLSRLEGKRRAASAGDEQSALLAELVAERSARLLDAQRRADDAAGRVGLPRPLSPVSLQRALDDAERLRDARRDHDAWVERVAEATAQLETAERQLASAAGEEEAARLALARFAAGLGAPDSYGAAELVEFVEQLALLNDRLGARRRVAAELAECEQAIELFEAGVSQLAALFGCQTEAAGSGAADQSVDALLDQMTSHLATVRERAGARRALLDEIEKAEQETERMLGLGERADSLRSELAAGRVLEWQEEVTEAAARLRELQGARDEALRSHERLDAEIERLASSADIPRLEQRCLELETRLRETLEQYLVRSGARLLLQRTLKRYENERQPAVLEKASRHFARVTEGRYLRLGIDSAPDGSKPTVRAFSPTGEVVDAASLSRGAMEQLYLCLRLGLAESFADRYLPLPVILDDVLVNADPERREQMARELVETGRHHQLVYLTCHPEVAALFARTAEGASANVRTVTLSRL